MALLTLSDEVYEKSDPRWINARTLRALALSYKQQHADVVKLLEPLQADMLRRADASSIEGLMSLSSSMAQLEGRAEPALILQRDITVAAMKNAQADPRSALAAIIAEADHFASVHRFKESLERAESALAFWKERALPLTSGMLRLHAVSAIASSPGDVARASAYENDRVVGTVVHATPSRHRWFVACWSYIVSLPV